MVSMAFSVCSVVAAVVVAAASSLSNVEE